VIRVIRAAQHTLEVISRACHSR